MSQLKVKMFSFQSISSRTRSFSTFSRVISDNARKVLNYTNVKAQELAGNNNTDNHRGSCDCCKRLQTSKKIYLTNPKSLNPFSKYDRVCILLGFCFELPEGLYNIRVKTMRTMKRQEIA